uniref:Uncharacterized protein n=1 Tax=Rhizophora mucronata TaxID=61149 RepID=A0A2P2P5V7_RHIMU
MLQTSCVVFGLPARALFCTSVFSLLSETKV